MFTNMCAHYKVPIYLFGTKDELGHAMGQEFRASLSVEDAGFAKSMAALMNVNGGSLNESSELANELGKTSKEVLDIVKQKDQSASLFAASSLSGDQEAMVRAAVSQKKEAPKASENGAKAEPAKKKLTAVFRPQNAQQQIKRPVPKQAPKRKLLSQQLPKQRLLQQRDQRLSLRERTGTRENRSRDTRGARCAAEP